MTMNNISRALSTFGALGLSIGGIACAPANKAPIAPAAPPPASAAVAAPAPAAPAAPVAPAAPAPLKRCANGTVAAADGLIDDFEDGNNQSAEQAGRSGYWFTAVDTAGSSIAPQGELKPSNGGANGSKLAGHVSGKTAPEQAAWGAVFGVGLLRDNQLYDASKYAGVSFWAKVGGKSGKSFRFKVSDVNTHPAGKVCTDGCWNHFGSELTLSTEWKEYTIPFTDLKQEEYWGSPRPATVTSNQLVSLDWTVLRGQEFDLWLDDIKLVDCK
jgi:hypothetical protein